MDYRKHYDQLMAKGINHRSLTQFENHHIVPKCMGGTNDDDNIVKLSLREHFVAHLLLVKMFPENQSLKWAALLMSGIRRYRHITSRKYDVLKSSIDFKNRDRSFMQSQEYREQRRKNMINVWNNSPGRRQRHRETIQKSTRKPIIGKGTLYVSLTECAKFYNVTPEAIRKRMLKYPDDYYYVVSTD